MAEFDHGFKMIAATNGRELARIAGLLCQKWEPLESTLQVTTERLADRVFLARQSREHFIVYFEFITQWNQRALWSMLGRSGLLSEREELPTETIPVILLPKGYKDQKPPFQLKALEKATQQLWYRPIRLWKTKPESWWEAEPGLMALYPLCQHGRRAPDAIRHAAQAIERDLPNEIDRADGLALLNIFGSLANPRLDVASIIGSEKMKESRVVREWREEGRMEQARNYILHLLRRRFGEHALVNLAITLNAIEEMTTLDHLFELASTCSNIAEFCAALPTHQATT